VNWKGFGRKRIDLIEVISWNLHRWTEENNENLSKVSCDLGRDSNGELPDLKSRASPKQRKLALS
jgi:hypothetical protein